MKDSTNLKYLGKQIILFLLLTIPHCTSKLYTNDLLSRKMVLQFTCKTFLSRAPSPGSYGTAHDATRTPYLYPSMVVRGKRKHSVLVWILTWRSSAIIERMVAWRHYLIRQPQKPII